MEPINHLIKAIWYCLHEYWIETADPRTKHFYLFEDGPERVLLVVSIYLLFVKWIGPWFMRHRKPFVLRWPMLFYNFTMVLINIFLFTFIITRIDYGRRFLNFKFPDQNDYSPDILLELKVGYLSYVTRFFDLFDTVFIVLRKKDNQISFLHLYHHTLVPIIGWMTMKIAPQAPVVGLFLMFNTLIHTLMYSYYGLSLFGPQMRKYLWWKKYLTLLQMVQFATCGIYSIVMVFLEQGFPRGLFWIGFVQNPLFFYMFYDFYKKTYHHHQQQKQIKKLELEKDKEKIEETKEDKDKNIEEKNNIYMKNGNQNLQKRHVINHHTEH